MRSCIDNTSQNKLSQATTSFFSQRVDLQFRNDTHVYDTVKIYAPSQDLDQFTYMIVS